MPSQENELDGLLKDLAREKNDDIEGAGETGQGQAPDLDDMAGLSEEEIEKLLLAGAQNKEDSEQAFVQGDVLELLGETGDEDLNEIGNLLKKSDRNEMIDKQGMESGSFEEKNPADLLLEEIEEAGDEKTAGNTLSVKEQKALEKQRRKEEKKAEKEAAKAEKEAAKAEKKAKRRLKKGNGDSETRWENEKNGGLNAGPSGIVEFDMTLDKDLLDNIVQEAGRVQPRKKSESRKREREPLPSGLTGAVELTNDDVHGDDSALTESGIMEVGFDQADSLFSESEVALREKEKPKEKAGFMKKVISFLMEEEEEPENENIKLSEENREILDELEEKEGSGSKKKKPKSKPKKKKDPKAKKQKAAKPKKPPKPKKERKPREEEETPFRKKLTFKKVLPIVLLGVSLGAVLFIFVNLVSDFSDKQAAENAYKKGDYETCYLNLYGKNLNEEQAEMYGKSESILYMRLLYREYEMILEKGTELEALDTLIQIVNKYPTVNAYIGNWGVVPEVFEIYSNVLNILYEQYGVTEQQAIAIAAIKSDISYTRMLISLTEKPFSGVADTPDAGEQLTGDGNVSDAPEEQLPNELPEESELEPGDFVDNQ